MTKPASSASPPPSSSMASLIKAYLVPLILFLGAVFYQVVVIPNSFPPSHYDVLQIKKYSSIEEVREAYEKLSSNWNSGVEVPVTRDIIKIQYAYELLKNPSWKKNYDIFGIDEHLDVLEMAKEHFVGRSFSTIDLPLLDSSVPEDHDLDVITAEDFESLVQDAKPLLIQLFSSGSKRCFQFYGAWKRIASLLDGVANTASVELEELQLVTYLAEKKPIRGPSFRNGIPSLVAFPSGCKSTKCLIRYDGELNVDAVTDWFATTILGLPRIFYHSKESMGPKFLATVSPHKVKVIIFSRTGERASPFVRQAAKNYWSDASFAYVLWREEESAFWFNIFEVETAPAIVFLKDPGVKPVVFHGAVNNSFFSSIMEQNKKLELPQLRSTTSLELGCDPRGYSRAGHDTSTWYCAILAGRHGPELNKMRETIRRVQETLSRDIESSAVDSSIDLASVALKSKRLTFAWLDGEAEKRYCFFYLNYETSYDTCGPRRDLTDVPRLFIVRYKRNASEESVKPEKKHKTMWDTLKEQDLDPASQLVAMYNGTDDILEIQKWISQIISDGDSRDLPHYRTRTPDLVAEESKPTWSRGAQSLPSTSTVKQVVRGFITKIYDQTGDPRVGPMMLLGALLSFGSIWLRRSQPTQQANQAESTSQQANQTESTQQEAFEPSQPGATNETKVRRRLRARKASRDRPPPSLTDDEPRDAVQMPFSDSDSD